MTRLRIPAAALAIFLGLSLTSTVHAQRDFFSDDRKQQQNVAGEFDYYALVLSWSPTHCSSTHGFDDDQQCNRSDGRRYSFILHGLWPQYEKGWPQNCRTRRKPYVPQPLMDSMMDIMPSEKLIIHEYRKHGTCSGLDPAGYYALSRKLFQAITIPEHYTNPFENQQVSPQKMINEFVAANPGLDPDAIAIACDSRRLKEIRICFSKAGKPQSCGQNENQRKLCSAAEMFVPPVRSTKTGAEVPRARKAYPASPLPGPR